MKIFVVVPAYNEEKRIGSVLSKLKNMGQRVVVVDDGSKDKTFQIAKRYTPFTIRHGVNLGKGAALKTGCTAAFSLGADAVILMDSDGQHKVSDLPFFIKALENGYSVVFGSRNMNYGVPLVRYLGNKVVSIMVNTLFGIYASDILCGFKAMTKSAYKKIRWVSKGYSVETEIVAMTGQYKLKNCEVPVATVYYDKFKGLTIEQGLGILLDIIRFRLK